MCSRQHWQPVQCSCKQFLVLSILELSCLNLLPYKIAFIPSKMGASASLVPLLQESLHPLQKLSRTSHASDHCTCCIQTLYSQSFPSHCLLTPLVSPQDWEL